VGAATVILVTPQSGDDLRRGIVSKVNEIVDAGKQAVADRRQELQDEYQVRTKRIQIPLNPPKPESPEAA
jgi:gas vesicle protein